MIKLSDEFLFDRQKINEFCKRQSIDLLILHGSYATGNVRKESDIDIGVLVGGELSKNEYWDIISKLTDILGDKCDCVLLNGAESMISFQTATNGVPLYERKKGLFDDFFTTSISRYQDAVKFRNLEKEYLHTHIKEWSENGE